MTDVMRPAETPLRDGLEQFIDTLPDGIIMAEIGCWTGESAAMFLRKASVLFCVDLWTSHSGNYNDGLSSHDRSAMEEVEKQFDSFIRAKPFVVKVKGASIQMAALFPSEMFDVVYIDANHEYSSVLADIKAWTPKVKPYGILAGHDYGAGGVSKALTESFNRVVPVFPDGSWMVQL